MKNRIEIEALIEERNELKKDNARYEAKIARMQVNPLFIREDNELCGSYSPSTYIDCLRCLIDANLILIDDINAKIGVLLEDNDKNPKVEDA